MWLPLLKIVPCSHISVTDSLPKFSFKSPLTKGNKPTHHLVLSSEERKLLFPVSLAARLRALQPPNARPSAASLRPPRPDSLPALSSQSLCVNPLPGSPAPSRRPHPLPQLRLPTEERVVIKV